MSIFTDIFLIYKASPLKERYLEKDMKIKRVESERLQKHLGNSIEDH